MFSHIFSFKKIEAFWGGPRSVMRKWLQLLTRMQEVRGSNPGAAPPKFGAQTPPYPASRSQNVSRVPPPLERVKAEHPG